MSLQHFVGLSHKTIFLWLLGLSMIACGSSGLTSMQTATVQPAAITSPSAAAEIDSSIPPVIASTVSTPDRSNKKAVFKVAVIVDMMSEPVTREQAQSIFDEANKLVQPFVTIGLGMVDFVQDGSGGATKDMAERYLASHPADLPNGILIFSFGDIGQAKLNNGYGYALQAPSGYRNAFVSPVGGANQIYIAVVRYGLKYMACGYGGADAVQSTHAMGGECNNKPGTACVQKNDYSMCANAVGNLYTSSPTHFASSMIIHMFLHSFSPGGDKDNYATPECNARMGYPSSFFDLQESEFYNGICPFVYENFAASYQP